MNQSDAICNYMKTMREPYQFSYPLLILYEWPYTLWMMITACKLHVKKADGDWEFTYIVISEQTFLHYV